MCPIGCPLEITEKDGKVQVTGNACKRGGLYGEQEYTSPKRIVTSLVRVDNGSVLSVKTDRLILKSDIFKVLEALKYITVKAPVGIGDVIAADIAGSGADLVATSNLK